MTLVEQVTADLTAAMKAGDAPKVSALRMLKAALVNGAIEQRVEALPDAAAQEVVRRQIKQHRESFEAFQKGGRGDLAAKESAELKYLEGYLPPQMSEASLRAIVQECVAASGAAGPKAMGQVMRLVMAKVQGQADGKTVSALVAQALAPPPHAV
ncbi:MAG: GatB/YqeY domain-containing protein [Candidatus Omnitrophica bacterium]|nr:GatB/YqeY domain-containing protein [Candidatus Omnitrophota bacterium]